ncbi:GDSL-type esterase/lipase family protein [Ignavigranum ruoffiae]|uniref:GDSL-type esterase/lipase family protein n=1 Tax=Ignavigranum ruoffiae TaxID=89093 RepID=UPI0024AE1793|nr:GDSL-type esterase/lipase family protein [Ignavigranum ruoffiae]
MAQRNYQWMILISILAALAGGFTGYYYQHQPAPEKLALSLGIADNGSANTDFIGQFPMSQHYMNRRTLFDQLKPSTGQTIFLGDEIIEEAEWRDLLGQSDILNRGIDLDTVAGVKDRLPQLLDQQPQQIILSIGRQDILQNSDYFQRDFEEILALINEDSPQIKLIVMDLIPLSQSYANSDKLNPVIEQFNKQLSDLQKEYAFELVAIGAELTDSEGFLAEEYSADGWQLNGQAYQKIVQALKPLLKGGE